MPEVFALWRKPLPRTLPVQAFSPGPFSPRLFLGCVRAIPPEREARNRKPQRGLPAMRFFACQEDPGRGIMLGNPMAAVCVPRRKGRAGMKSFVCAAKAIVPILFAYVFVGIAFSLMMMKAGYGLVWIVLSSVFVYAGSMQIVMVTLLTAGAPLAVVAVTALFVNARHLFYGLSFLDEFRAVGREKGGWWRYPYMALTLTDEAYSVLCSLQTVPEGCDRHKVQFYVLLLCHLLWVASCTAGAALGGILNGNMAGIEFSATAFFTAVVVNQWKESRSHIPALVGLCSAVLFYFVAGPDGMILPALSLSMVTLLLFKNRIPAALPEDCHE